MSAPPSGGRLIRVRFAAGAEARPLLDQLRSGEADDEDGQVADPVHEVLEEVEQARRRRRAGPRPAAARSGAGRGPRRTAATRRTGRPGAARRAGGGQPEQRREPARHERPVGIARRTGRRGTATACPRSCGGRRRRPRRAGRGRSRSAPSTPCPRRTADTEPRCQNTVSASPSTYFSSSQPSRDLPTPAGPETRARRGRRSRVVACSSSFSRPSSTARPTKGASSPSVRWAPPMPETTSRARQRVSGSALPFSSTSPCRSNSMASPASRRVAVSTSTLPAGAADWTRAAVFTASPATIACPSAASVAATVPVTTPARAARPGAPTWRAQRRRPRW